MSLVRRISGLEGKNYEKQNILGQRDRFLFSDVAREGIPGKRSAEKIHQIEATLGAPQGIILNIGANTCEEAEYLATRGYSVIAADINDVALGFSQKRCAKFKKKAPTYLACDGQHLPIRNDSIQFAMFSESLDHMDDPLQVLKEVNRVLVPGGRIYLNEPYGYKPYRLLSEMRDRLRETYNWNLVAALKRLLRDGGLGPVSIRHHAYIASDSKMEIVNIICKALRTTYVAASKICSSVFGGLVVVAEKPKGMSVAKAENSFELLLRCPVTGSRIVRVKNQGYLSLDQSFRGLYPFHHGIPILVSEAGKRVDCVTWENLISTNFIPTL